MRKFFLSYPPGSVLFFVTLAIASCHNGREKTPPPPVQAIESPKIDTVTMIHNLEISFSSHPDLTAGLKLANLYAETKNPKVLTLCDALLTPDSTRELADPIFIKGIYYANTGDTTSALQLFDKCIHHDWKFIEAYIEKGIIQYGLKEYKNALKTFELAIQVANTYPDVYYWLGKCQEATGQKTEALTNYYRATALDKDFKEANDAIKRITSSKE